MACVAQHFTRIHGMETGLAPSVRLMLLGLPAGTRLASGDNRAKRRETSAKLGLGKNLRPGGQNSEHLIGANAFLHMLKKSDAMKAGNCGSQLRRTLEAHKNMDHPYSPRKSGGKTHCSICHRRLVAAWDAKQK